MQEHTYVKYPSTTKTTKTGNDYSNSVDGDGNSDHGAAKRWKMNRIERDEFFTGVKPAIGG